MIIPNLEKMLWIVPGQYIAIINMRSIYCRDCSFVNLKIGGTRTLKRLSYYSHHIRRLCVSAAHLHASIDNFIGRNSATEVCSDVESSFEPYHVNNIIIGRGNGMEVTFSGMHEVQTLAPQ